MFTAPMKVEPRGPNGEIYLQHLVEGIDAETLKKFVVDENKKIGQVYSWPKYGFGLDVGVAHAAHFWHNHRLREVMAGNAETNYEVDIYSRVVVYGDAISMNPPAAPDLRYDSFEPVFRCLNPLGLRDDDDTSPMRWAVGVQGSGRYQVIVDDDGAQAVAKAQRLIYEWVEADNQAFDERAKAALERMGDSMFHDWAANELVRDMLYEIAPGWGLRPVGNHTSMEIYLNGRMRVFDTGHGRAVRVIYALARSAGVKFEWPGVGDFAEWLEEQNAPAAPQAQWSKGLDATPVVQFKHEGKTIYGIIKGKTLTFREVVGQQYKGVLAETDMDGLNSYLIEPEGRTAIIRWVLWSHRQKLSVQKRAESKKARRKEE